jgi:hypothetical protein
MAVLSYPSFGPRTAIWYVTVGILVDVWTAVWYFAFGRPAGESLSNTTCFWLAGFFLTGLSLIAIGLLLGRLGRAARRAELPPEDAMALEGHIQQTAAANPAPVVAPPPVNPAIPVTPVTPAVTMPAAAPAVPKPVVVGS